MSVFAPHNQQTPCLLKVSAIIQLLTTGAPDVKNVTAIAEKNEESLFFDTENMQVRT